MYSLECGEYRHIINWSTVDASGFSFTVVDPAAFTKQVLPTLFKTAKFDSFQRKLYRWGFVKKRTRAGNLSISFVHPFFQKGNFGLCARMTCNARTNRMNLPSNYLLPPTMQNQFPNSLVAPTAPGGLHDHRLDTLFTGSIAPGYMNLQPSTNNSIGNTSLCQPSTNQSFGNTSLCSINPHFNAATIGSNSNCDAYYAAFAERQNQNFLQLRRDINPVQYNNMAPPTNDPVLHQMTNQYGGANRSANGGSQNLLQLRRDINPAQYNNIAPPTNEPVLHQMTNEYGANRSSANEYGANRSSANGGGVSAEMTLIQNIAALRQLQDSATMLGTPPSEAQMGQMGMGGELYRQIMRDALSALQRS